MAKTDKTVASSLKIITITVFFLLVLSINFSDLGEGQTLHVGSEEEYTSIQTAIDAAHDGDIIKIHEGIYAENLIIQKNIKLHGVGAESTKISGNGNGDVIHIEDCSVEIKNLSIMNSGKNRGDAGIRLTNANSSLISNVHLLDNTDGMYAYFCDNIEIQNSTIDFNSQGIHVFFSTNVDITQNIIEQNARRGIYLQASDENTIASNKITVNIKENIVLEASSLNEVTGNEISSSETGIYLLISENNIIANNIVTSNTIGIFIEEGDNNIVYDNNFVFNYLFNAKNNGMNFWNTGSSGNYWDDYTGVDDNHDGIGDTPYLIPGAVANEDFYPKMNPTVTDQSPPKIVSISAYPNVQELYGRTNISCTVTDNIAVKNVFVNITFPNETSSLVECNKVAFGNTFFYSIICTEFGAYEYQIIAYDVFNNVNASTPQQFSVDYPQEPTEITRINTTPNPGEFPEVIAVTCNVTDNVAVQVIHVTVSKTGDEIGNYTLSPISIDEFGNGRYGYNCTPPSVGEYEYRIWASDINNNTNGSQTYTFLIKDTTPPKIFNVSAEPVLQNVNESVNISCIISDNHAIESVHANISCPNGTIYNETLHLFGGKYSTQRSFSSNGIYTYTISAEDKSNNTNESLVKTFKITYFPIANFSYLPINVTDIDMVSFNASASYDIDGTITNYTWTFYVWINIQEAYVLLATKYGVKVENQFMEDSPPTYLVNLTVIDNDTALGYEQIELLVANVPPVAKFNVTPSSPLVNEPVSFMDESYDVDGEVRIWIWDFGDGNTSLETNPTYTYHWDGDYTVILNITDNDYAMTSYAISIEVRDIQSPTITNISANPNPQEIYEIVNISCIIQDDVKVSQTRINISIPDGNNINESLIAGNNDRFNYYYFCTNEGEHEYVIWAIDRSGNVNVSSPRVFDIITPPGPPEISEITITPEIQQYSYSTNISCYVWDNVATQEVNFVTLDMNITMGNSTDEYGNGIYYLNSSFEISIVVLKWGLIGFI